MKYTLPEFILYLQKLAVDYSNADIAIETDNGFTHQPDINLQIASSLSGKVRIIIESKR